MLRLLVRSAPGVRAISSLLTIDTGVDDWAGRGSGEAVTATFCSTPATFSGKRKTAALPERTVTCCSIDANPDAITVTAYSPTGTASNAKAPSVSETVVCDQSDVRERIVTCAPGIDRSAGSWIIPRTLPKTAALTKAGSRSNVKQRPRHLQRILDE